MNRRLLLRTLAAGVGTLAIPHQYATAEGESTPRTAEAIPPIRWNLVSIDTEDSALTPINPSRYWVQFLDDGVVYIKADCNSASGSYEVDGDSITITDIISTLVMCEEDSIDQEFLNALGAVTGFSSSSDGSDQLLLSVGDDGQSATFSASLEGVVWEWEQFAAGNDSTITPDAPERYTIQFLEEGSIQITADCNTGGGEAVVDGNQLDLMVTVTEVACGDDSESDQFLRILDEATSYVIGDGKLHLALPMDAGIATLRARVPEAADADATPQA